MRFVIFVLLLLTFDNVIAQSRQQKQFSEPSTKEKLLMEMANECVDTHRYNQKRRQSFYPFNKASRIEIISFQGSHLIPIKMRRADYDEIHEYRQLSADQIDTLTDILYNVDYDPLTKLGRRIIGEYKCYEPRNGILFFNKRGEVFEFIEICFECHKTRSSSRSIIEGEYCNQKFNLLKDFFRNAGIKYVENQTNAILSYDELLKLDTNDLFTALRAKLDDKRRYSEILDSFTPVERKIFFLLNAQNIYFGGITGSGLVDFYYNYSGAFAQQTADALAEIGAEKTLVVLKSSLIDWPEGKLKSGVVERRKYLLVIADDVFPKWEALEATLYFHAEKDPDGTLSEKENLDGLIFDYIMSNDRHLLMSEPGI